jgi:hypothetical protein
MTLGIGLLSCGAGIPKLPDYKKPIRAQLGTIGLKAAQEPPEVRYEVPPGEITRSFLKGWREGGIIGSEAIDKFLQALQEKLKEQEEEYRSRYGRSYTPCVYNNGFSLCDELGIGRDMRKEVISLAVYAVTFPVDFPGRTVSSLKRILEEANSTDKTKELEEDLNQAIRELKIQETMRDYIFKAVEEYTTSPVIALGESSTVPTGNATSSAVQQEFDTVLETRVLEIGMLGEHFEIVNPRLRWFIIVRTTLSRRVDGTIIDQRSYGYHGGVHTFEEWAADDAKRFREELRDWYKILADHIVKDLFRATLQKGVAL